MMNIWAVSLVWGRVGGGAVPITEKNQTLIIAFKTESKLDWKLSWKGDAFFFLTVSENTMTAPDNAVFLDVLSLGVH